MVVAAEWRPGGSLTFGLILLAVVLATFLLTLSWCLASKSMQSGLSMLGFVVRPPVRVAQAASKIFGRE
jgi:hypothetical protein